MNDRERGRDKLKEEMYNKVFGSFEGKKVLEDLCKHHYIKTPTFDSKNSEHETVYKEGQRWVVLRILGILNNKEI